MKKRTTTIPFLIGTLPLLLTGCNNTANDNPVEQEGQPTKMTIVIPNTVPPGTRADEPKDANATKAEITLKKADVFIFSQSGSFELHKELQPGDFTYENTSGDLYKGTAEIDVRTGRKKLYIGVNLPDDMLNVITNNGPWGVSTHADPAVLYDLTGTGMTMFNEQEQDVNFVTDPSQNLFTIRLNRLTAKVTFQEGTQLDPDAVVSKAKYGGLVFALANLNTKVYPLQRVDKKDPNYSAVVTVSPPSLGYIADFVEEYSSGNYIAVTSKTENDIENIVAKYAVENTSEKHLVGETTFAVIRASFVPQLMATYSNLTGITEVAPQGPIPESLYVLKTQGSEFFYFADEAQANNANLDIYAWTGTVDEYKDGYCYYRIFLNSGGSGGSGANYDVLRNEYYRYTVDEIGGLGYNKPDPDPDEIIDPVDQPTQITVSVEVLNWVPYGQGVILEQ